MLSKTHLQRPYVPRNRLSQRWKSSRVHNTPCPTIARQKRHRMTYGPSRRLRLASLAGVWISYTPKARPVNLSSTNAYSINRAYTSPQLPIGPADAMSDPVPSDPPMSQ